jgi:hypothetical protein
LVSLLAGRVLHDLDWPKPEGQTVKGCPFSLFKHNLMLKAFECLLKLGLKPELQGSPGYTGSHFHSRKKASRFLKSNCSYKLVLISPQKIATFGNMRIHVPRPSLTSFFRSDLLHRTASSPRYLATGIDVSQLWVASASVRMFVLQLTLGLVALVGTILAIFAWSGAGL